MSHAATPRRPPSKKRRAGPAPSAVGPALRRAYVLLRRHFGHQNWWPAESPFEVCVGAILTQNTNWSNVERALSQLKHRRLLDPHRLLALPAPELAQLIRSAGYYNVKARRLRAFLHVLVHQHHGQLTNLFAGPISCARERLLAIPGIGPETADSMLLYAATHPSFVVDAYTRRIFTRHGWCPESASYDELKALCETHLAAAPRAGRLDYWRDYHAQLVMTGKDYCRPRDARCAQCPLAPLLPLAPRYRTRARPAEGAYRCDDREFSERAATAGP